MASKAPLSSPAVLDEVVVLVHGLWMTGLELSWMRHRLRSQHGFEAVAFSYPTMRNGLDANAAALRAFSRTLDARTVHYVGHSLGGLVLMRALREFDDARPGRVVCLGVPVAGSRAAQGIARWPLGKALLGRSVNEELLDYRERRWTCDRELGVIAGTVGLGMGRFVADLPKPHDGTVALRETKLPGARDRLVLPVTHTSMLFSGEVASQVAHFLRDGRFAPKPGRPH